MSSVIIKGDTSGQVELASPAVAGSSVQTLVAATGTLAPLIAGTAVTASGTSVDFTGIPSWVKRITVMFDGVSTNGTGIVGVRLGSSGTPLTAGYLGSSISTSTTANNGSPYTSLMAIQASAAANIRYGFMTITNITGNKWVSNGVFSLSDSAVTITTASTISLSGTLDIVRITTTNGTDTFDAGTINILYE